ncbi:MAG: UbiD family decarboxylase [Thermoplasmatales archaeon]|nr:UbiD family decarboxylase [Thermoplasmatales archaeon]
MTVKSLLPKDLHVVKGEIDPDSQDASRAMAEDQGRTVFFESLNGRKAVGNLFSTREKIAAALGVEPSDFMAMFSDAIDNPVPTKVAKDAPFRKNVLEKDLTKLPICKYYPGDRGRYIASGVVVAERDGKRNVSFHRMLIAGKDRIAIRLVPRHLFTMHKAALEAGEDLKVSICIGARPEVLLSAAVSTDYGKDELEIASAMHKAAFGKPLPVGRTDNGLLVPMADYVIEGRITAETMDEGPFVDITGTYDEVRKQPVIEVDKIWSCDDPVMHLLLPGGNEHFLFMGMPREPMIFKTVRQAVPRVHGVRLTEGGCCWLNGVVSITKNKEGDGVNAIMAAFTGHPSMKNVVVVDADVDIHDDRAVEWAVATRFQADRLVVVKDAAGSSLDPSADGTTCKMGIDATLPLGRDLTLFKKATL